MKRSQLLIVLMLSVSLVALQACSTIASKKPEVVADAKDIVASRAEARWKALILGNLDHAYAFISPATRKVMPLDAYKKRVKLGMWRDVKIESVACTDDVCSASVLLKYDIRDIKDVEKVVEESWIKEDGEWWFVQKK
ncbi:MAG: hypothetical protein V4805_02120 [Pseudomonadota bacterium]